MSIESSHLAKNKQSGHAMSASPAVVKPGLGDKIERGKSDWIDRLRGAGGTGDKRLQLRADGGSLDQISGATVTSRAVAEAVANALLYFAANRTTLLEAPLPAIDEPANAANSTN